MILGSLPQGVIIGRKTGLTHGTIAKVGQGRRGENLGEGRPVQGGWAIDLLKDLKSRFEGIPFFSGVSAGPTIWGWGGGIFP